MKRFFILVLFNVLFVESRVFLSRTDDKRPNLGDETDHPLLSSPGQSCSSNAACGENDCCFVLTGECYPKPTQDQSCSPESTCPCAADLVCKVYRTFGTETFYRCMMHETR